MNPRQHLPCENANIIYHPFIKFNLIAFCIFQLSVAHWCLLGHYLNGCYLFKMPIHDRRRRHLIKLLQFILIVKWRFFMQIHLTRFYMYHFDDANHLNDWQKIIQICCCCLPDSREKMHTQSREEDGDYLIDGYR